MEEGEGVQVLNENYATAVQELVQRQKDRTSASKKKADLKGPGLSKQKTMALVGLMVFLFFVVVMRLIQGQHTPPRSNASKTAASHSQGTSHATQAR